MNSDIYLKYIDKLFEIKSFVLLFRVWVLYTMGSGYINMVSPCVLQTVFQSGMQTLSISTTRREPDKLLDITVNDMSADKNCNYLQPLKMEHLIPV